MNRPKSIRRVERIASVEYMPSVSIVLPFSPVTMLKQELDMRIKNITTKVESMLIKEYTSQKAMPVIYKLKNVIKNLNYYTHKKSLVIFVSPMIEKVFYLGMDMNEKVSVDPGFKMADLVNLKKEKKEHFILVLSDHFSRMFQGSGSELRLIKSNTLVEMDENKNEGIGHVNSFLTGFQMGLNLERFLHQMDVGLSIMLKSYQLPVFALGSKNILDQFKKITRNDEFIVEYIDGNYNVSSGCDLMNVTKHFLDNWYIIKDRFLMNLVKKSKLRNRLAAGLNDAKNATRENKADLLIMERNYGSLTNTSEIYDSPKKENDLFNPVFYLKDEIDELIEKIFENGGDIEFVSDGVLDNYGHVVLIEP